MAESAGHVIQPSFATEKNLVTDAVDLAAHLLESLGAVLEHPRKPAQLVTNITHPIPPFRPRERQRVDGLAEPLGEKVPIVGNGLVESDQVAGAIKDVVGLAGRAIDVFWDSGVSRDSAATRYSRRAFNPRPLRSVRSCTI